jgi:hypothetical protein
MEGCGGKEPAEKAWETPWDGAEVHVLLKSKQTLGRLLKREPPHPEAQAEKQPWCLAPALIPSWTSVVTR